MGISPESRLKGGCRLKARPASQITGDKIAGATNSSWAAKKFRSSSTRCGCGHHDRSPICQEPCTNQLVWINKRVCLSARCYWMLRIERVKDGRSTVLKLSGRIEEEYLAQLYSEIEKSENATKLDLRDVSLVDRSSVRFLIECESRRIELLNPPLYVREWISRERKQGPPRRH